MPHALHIADRQGNWLAPTPLARQRVIERIGALDRTVRINGLLAAAVMLATAIFSDAWALLPLGVLAAGIAIGPLAVRRGAMPEYAELVIGTCVTVAIAAGAGVTGGAASPLVFLLPIGVVMNALRATPASIVVESGVTAVVFLAASLLADGGSVRAEPLPTIAVLAAVFAVTLGSVALADAEIGYRRASIIDPLTGLLNRQALETRFEELRQQALLADAPIGLVLFDLDHFKQVNDVHGHDAGDRLLREIAYEVRKSLRKFELIYRVGGEEFLVLLPGSSEADGELTAERLRAAVEGVRLQGDIGVTASFGVSCGGGEQIDFVDLYRRADEALYEAKRGGRDRVIAAA